jgi:uncharacterized protein YdhG (YjbR/CyaY superfamily)
MQSDAKTVTAYLATLPDERREVVTTLRDTVRANLPEGYEEAMTWGMITFQVPLSLEPNTYNGQPLAYVAIAAQKNGYSFYWMADDGDSKLAAAWGNTKRKPDIGKSCLRFKSLADVDLPTIGKLVATVSVAARIAQAKR